MHTSSTTSAAFLSLTARNTSQLEVSLKLADIHYTKGNNKNNELHSNIFLHVSMSQFRAALTRWIQ